MNSNPCTVIASIGRRFGGTVSAGVLDRDALSRAVLSSPAELDALDPSMQAHPVFLFSRAQRARQFELWDDAIAWLDKAKGDAPAVDSKATESKRNARESGSD